MPAPLDAPHEPSTTVIPPTGSAPAGPQPQPTGAIPPRLTDLVEEFQALGERDRLQLLLDLSRDLPELPPRIAERKDLLEAVVECQSPVFVLAEVTPSGPEGLVQIFVDAPAESPTTRGFAGILLEAMNGLPAREALAVPDDVLTRLGLTAAVSPLRLVGMSAMLHRIRRQIRVKAGLGGTAAR